MSPQEKLSQVQRFIDESFAEGKPLDEVLREIKIYLATLDSPAPPAA